MIRFIENIGDYYSQHFFADDFPKKVFDKVGYVTQKKDSEGNKTANHLTEINARISPLREKYYRFKNDLLTIQREKDKVKRTHEFHKEVLDALGYMNGTPQYDHPVLLNETEALPVRLNYQKGNKCFLFVMEMKAIVREGEKEPQGIYEQTWLKEEWEGVFPSNWGEVVLNPEVIKDALSELFLMPEEVRPVYVIMLAGAKIFLIHYEKWKYDSFLLFDLEELFNESLIPANRDYLSLFYALLAKENFLGDTDSLLQSLDEDAHKAAYGVTQNLKKGVIYAVESIANEAIWYKKNKAKTPAEKDAIEKLMTDERFARELKDECLTMVYRLLFLFYAEAREDLEILPVKDHTYQKGYSLEMLRDLEMVPLTTESSRNGYFISESLWKLFEYLHNGVKTKNGFEMKPLDSPLFDNAEMKHLKGVQFKNEVLQGIIRALSLSDRSKGKRIGRISYANLGINQLGSVYESLLAYSGFFATEPLIEVKAEDDTDGKEGTYLVPLKRRDDFKEDEILKDPENPTLDKTIPKGYFVYRLNGRDRKKSASYYTPEVLTQTTVRYALKGIIDSIKERQHKGEFCADEILSLKILEPAMGAAAFHNEVINQLADAYLELKETEEVRRGGTRILPGKYADETQKVKAFIAANNVYGVDLNPTAVELGKLSLWLNCMHKNMETPFFAHRLGTGNAVIGCWLKVYDEKDVLAEYPKSGTPKQRLTPLPKTWWQQAPVRVKWDKKGRITRKPRQFYHFLLPDDNMLVSGNISFVKDEMNDAQKKAVNACKKEFKKPLSQQECNRLEKLCRVIDVLLEDHYRQIKGIIKDTTSVYAVYGHANPQMQIKGYDEKERLADSRNARSAPYYKLRMVMDYWCSLWFWDARNIVNWPTREQWYNEIENILGVDLSSLSENAMATELLENIKKNSADRSRLFDKAERLDLVEKLHRQHRFFHHELEFIEVFKERGGFDIIAGNPPWVTIEFDEASLLSDSMPEIILRKMSAPEVSEISKQKLKVNSSYKSQLITEVMTTEPLKVFVSSLQSYPLLAGQRNNLYKCIITNSFETINANGYIGLVHPDGIFDVDDGNRLRAEVFRKMAYHFHFINKLQLFSEVYDGQNYSINIYRGNSGNVSFCSINDLLHPGTIEACFDSNHFHPLGGMMKKNKNNGEFEWNLSGHPGRLINVSLKELTLFRDIFDPTASPIETRLVSIYSQSILKVFDKLVHSKDETSPQIFITDCWNETTAVKDGFIKKENKVAEIKKYELVLSGSHFTVNNPLYRSPRAKYKSRSDFDIIILTAFKPQRTLYTPACDLKTFKNRFAGIDPKNAWIDTYRLAVRKMLNPSNERTIQACIIPPKASHTNGIISLQFLNSVELLKATSICCSILFDYLIKSLGITNFQGDHFKNYNFQIPKSILKELMTRTLVLNCLTDNYSELYNDAVSHCLKSVRWSKADHRLNKNQLKTEWSKEPLLVNFYERRLANIENDVLLAMAIGLNVEDLILIYTLKFRILEQNEDDTWYDQKGNIVFTCSKSLTGVGLDRPEWEKITEETGATQRTLKKGDTYTHTVAKSELYQNQKVTYYAPFDKSDRAEDYKAAWAHFEKIFNSK